MSGRAACVAGLRTRAWESERLWPGALSTQLFTGPRLGVFRRTEGCSEEPICP
jgi:hypothetical protein